MRKLAKTLLVFLRVGLVVGVVGAAFTIWPWRSRNPQALRLIKRSNKYVTNPLVLRFSGRSGSSAIVCHVGRRSGTPYATPVSAHQTHRHVIIPLPYGTDVDWLRNVLAAGHAVVHQGGQLLTVEDPAVVSINDVLHLLPVPMAGAVRLNGVRHALRMRVSQSGQNLKSD